MNRLPEPSAGKAPVEAWQGIYCSLALILAVFFVMLVSFSTADVDRVRDFQGQFHKGGGPAAGGGDRGDGQGKGRPAVLDRSDAGMPSLADAEKHLRKILADSGAGQKIVLDRSRGGLRARISSDVLFEADSADLRPDLQPCLREMAQEVRKGGYGLTVEGHTDNAPPRNGGFSSNWELSTARAVRVVRLFLDEEGIEAGRLQAVGFAQYRPPADGTASARTDNGRIELVFLPAGEAR
ncbi:MAG TPA: flagellar motor protein MotB [Syntrophales bacterium]|nr:flagellar motor protein MotB [Syntrophales bacterium]